MATQASERLLKSVCCVSSRYHLIISAAIANIECSSPETAPFVPNACTVVSPPSNCFVLHLHLRFVFAISTVHCLNTRSQTRTRTVTLTVRKQVQTQHCLRATYSDSCQLSTPELSRCQQTLSKAAIILKSVLCVTTTKLLFDIQSMPF